VPPIDVCSSAVSDGGVVTTRMGTLKCRNTDRRVGAAGGVSFERQKTVGGIEVATVIIVEGVRTGGGVRDAIAVEIERTEPDSCVVAASIANERVSTNGRVGEASGIREQSSHAKGGIVSARVIRKERISSK